MNAADAIGDARRALDGEVAPARVHRGLPIVAEDTVTLSVSDDGVGLPSEDRDAVDGTLCDAQTQREPDLDWRS